ncbi:MAG TPA: ATP-binding protein [Steroidobacteraceae bacterium]|jgi:hypothetical protein|nr:ATP-binding protein [Steroidobacteraceae bacterium]
MSARLLIVDDETAQMRALCDTLEIEGYQPTGYSSATKALANLRPGEFDLLLTDLMMPELDGISMVRAAREIDPDLAGIIMTGHGTIDTAVAAMQVGAVDYVLKPFKLNVILSVVERALELRRLRLDNALLQEREREQAVELAAAYKDLESFSYSVSHDLRSPLRAIRGFAEIFVSEFGAGIPAEGRGHLDRVMAGAVRMDRLIEDLLRFCRYSRMALARRHVDLEGITRRIVADVLAAHPDRKIEVQIGSLPACNGDPSLLEQVLVNLVSNAVKFTRDQTTARIEIGSLAPSNIADLQPAACTYFIRDNGAGFDMMYADKLFGVFQRLHSEEQFSGTGVGLSIVQRVLQRHGGRIWAESAPDKGATFYFTLPAVATQTCLAQADATSDTELLQD